MHMNRENTVLKLKKNTVSQKQCFLASSYPSIWW